MLTILEESDNNKELRNFRSLHWRSSNILTNTLTETFWNVRTNYRLHTYLKYMKMKVLFGQANELEVRSLFDAPGVLKDNLFTSALRAKHSSVPMNILLQRIEFLQQLLSLERWSLNLYYTFDKDIRYELSEIRRSIRKVKKYSGYVKNSSSVGTKKRSRTFNIIPETFEWTVDEELDLYEFLTVGKFSGSQLEILCPEDGPKSPKR